MLLINKLFSLVVLLVCACRVCAERPNIIVVLFDDMGYSDLGAFGGEIDTPNIDDLARKGLRFTQSYNSARCVPSRASLLTGLYSHQAGLANFTGGDQSARRGPAYLGQLNDQCVTIAEVLKEVGYATYGVGKWHVGHEVIPTQRGFDAFYGYLKGYEADQWDPSKYERYPLGTEPELKYGKEQFYATDVFSDYALEFIKQGQKSEKPFFLYLAHSSPHFPLQAPAETRDKYLEVYRKGWDVLRKERYQRQKKIGLATESWSFTELSQVPEDEPEISNHFGGKSNPAWDSLDADRQEDLVYRMATFAAMIEHVDTGIGRLIKQLEENGDLENTLILLTSDNGACYEWGPYGFDGHSRDGITTLYTGDQLGVVGGPGTYHSVGSAWSCLSNTPLRMYKHFNHEGGNCSPLVVYWPAGISNPDRWVREPVHLIDYMPTICDVAQARYPAEFNDHAIQPVEGVSLRPLFEGADTLDERTLYFDHFESSAIRKGPWKLVRGNKRYKNRTWELYNISKDRCETQDMIASHPKIAEQLEAEWLEWANRVKVHPYWNQKSEKQKK